MIKNYKELDVWKNSMLLVQEIYIKTRDFSENEKFGLVSQMRRASVSIPSNIAEGWGRKTTKDYVKFLHISLGSLYELETQVIICENINLIDNNNLKEIHQFIKDISKMLNVLIYKLNKKGNKIEIK
ncbi:MAG: four helix bundle protein [Candidatus Muirbacterium halophilum]|nr:four helix bundle protein [Candidatus Muirbacterium halophilum]MCK9476389.1 four helix bundle protein [Candidatus Muirbacterium halophilum]